VVSLIITLMSDTVRMGSGTNPDLLIIGAWSSEAASNSSPHAQEALSRKEFKGELGEAAEVFPTSGPRVVVIGLGDTPDLDPKAMRKAAAAAARKADSAKSTSISIAIEGLRDPAFMGRCLGEAFGLLAWSPKTFNSKPAEAREIELHSADPILAQGLAYGTALAESANFSRTLAWTPPSIATPLWMAEQAKTMAAATGLEYRVIEGEELEAERLTGLATVGRASHNPPCLIRLAWNPAGSEGQKPVVLIGKTVTYDTGGLSIKGREGMLGMKADKSGGCAVLGAMHAVATLIKPDFPVVALLAAAENSINGDAYRPDDIITYRDGTTVEVTNTDAEGRLVLADALCWAKDEENPWAMVDLATLTGGVVTALGSTYAGVFCHDTNLLGDLNEAGTASGERVWRLPLDPEYKALMKSEIADMVNSKLGGKAHPVQGAIFLDHFVPAGLPWAHIDIAGVAGHSSDTGPFRVGPSGFGVRLLADLLRSGLSLPR
jgi:leucyl aminopeptidase